MIRFKDLRVVDMRDGEPDEVQHQAHRTKRTGGEWRPRRGAEYSTAISSRP